MPETPLEILLVENGRPNPLELASPPGNEALPHRVAVRVERLSEAIGQLAERSFDAVLLDLSLADCQGLDGLAAVRRNAPQTPIVVLTDEQHERWGVEAVRLGAQDYLLKGPWANRLLPRALNNALERHRDQQLLCQAGGNAESLAERTAQLETANKELEAFSYSVSHDLRAPLRAISGFSRIVLDEYAPQLEPRLQQYLQRIWANTQQMGKLVDDLLAFSRLSRQPLDKQPVSVHDLVRVTLDELREEQTGRRVDISLQDLPSCLGDRALLKQVWMNLLRNALKFTRKREVAVIEIGCQKTDDECIYHVRDNGVGFDMRYVDKLFGVFQRLHCADEYEGTGVGLALVQRVIRRHGGRVWATAEVDHGATFYFAIAC